MNARPVILKKHWFGLALILAAGFLIELVLVLATLALHTQGTLTPRLYAFLGVVMILVLLATLITAYVYRLSSIVLTDAGMTFTNWSTLFFDNVAEAEWTQVEDVTATQGGVFAQIFMFGTLTVQTAGTDRNVKMTMVPRVQYWRAHIEAKAAAAPTLTHPV